MDRFGPSIIIAGIIILALTGMYFGWRARVRKHRSLVAPSSVPATIGETLAVDKGLYVATTLAEQPLERVAAHGLGFRSRVTVSVLHDGIVIDLTGRAPYFIPRDAIEAVERGTWAIDKAVEPGGLVVLTWTLGDTILDSYFRMDNGPVVLLNAGAELVEGVE